MTNKYQDEVICVTVKYAGHEALADAALDCGGVDAVVSEAFDKKMRALIGRRSAWRGASKALKITARIAAVLAVFIVISTAVIFSSEALRVEVANLFHFNSGENQTSIGFTGADTQQLAEGIVLPGYLPKGFELVETNKKNLMIKSRYENEAGAFITIEQNVLNSHINANSDSFSETEIAGRTVYFLEDDEFNVVIFNNEMNSFILSANIDISELLIIAESMLSD